MSRGWRSITCSCVAAGLLSLCMSSFALAQSAMPPYAAAAGTRSANVPPTDPPQLAYSDFLEQVSENKVRAVDISGQEIRIDLRDGRRFVTLSPLMDDASLIEALMRENVRIRAERPSSGFTFSAGNLLLLGLVVLVVGIGVGSFIKERRQRGARGPDLSKFSKSRARRIEPEEVDVSFVDAAGIDEAKQEVGEIVEFLKDPGKFRRLGGKIPKGVLMVGAPGTGKTLLARAIAGEAKVPFFSVCGADFVEMFVGVGAARVRDLFAQAKQSAPCIVFIDEIDAVGRHRAAGGSGGNDEREHTLNQLLVEMDGFAGTEGIIVIAATNRPDVLDAALLRPGRFDRQVIVPLPDVCGREQILRVHLKGVPVAQDVSPALVARGTSGFSGAELASLVNEAALFAARDGRAVVAMAELERAKDKIMLGTERRSLRMSERERRLTAYHEAGHAIVGHHVPDHDPLYKVSILPRGEALGLTVYLPEADRYSQTKRALESRICALLGGRIAEALIFGADQVTTGAANDLTRATEIARRMVTEYGMSDALGPLDYGRGGAERASAGGGSGVEAALSSDTARAIDAAVREIIDRNYARAQQLLVDHQDELERVAEALLVRETLGWPQLEAILHGCDPGAPDSHARINRTARSRTAACRHGNTVRRQSPQEAVR